MQTIAIACISLAALPSAGMLGTLWYIAATGKRPAWVEKLVG